MCDLTRPPESSDNFKVLQWKLKFQFTYTFLASFPLLPSFLQYTYKPYSIQAVNADSSNAPKQLHLILTIEHPEWKLPERRVAKYLKRQLKERNDDKYKDIDADLDEISLYTETSSSTWRTSDTRPVPATVAAAKPREAAPVKVAKKARTGVTRAYEDDNNKSEVAPLFCECEGCVIS